MHKTQKEQVVAELTERLKTTEAIIVADYRGLTNSQLVGLRAKLREHGAKLQVVKNTLTRRAAEAAGTESLLALLEGPSAIAFVETDGDPVAVAKALSDVAKETKILSLRGGVLSGKTMTGEDVEELSKLPPADVIKSQLVGVIIAPLTQLLALIQAPVQDLVGLIDARITQLGDAGEGDPAPVETPSSAQPEAVAEVAGDEPATEDAPVAEAAVEEAPVEEPPAAEEPVAEAAADEEPAAEEPAEETTDEPDSE
jgi:large subunit ribosomal protein L10